MKSLTPPLIIFISAIVFSFGVTKDLGIYVLLSLIYVLFITLTAISLIYKIFKSKVNVGPSYIVFLTLCNHTGIFLGFFLAGGADSMIWAADAMDHHLPNAIAFSEWLSGAGDINIFDENPFKIIYISNVWVGIFFYLLGVSPLVTGLAIGLVKIATIFVVYRASKELTSDSSISSVAAIIYALSPTITFYTIQFYKDFFIQFLVSIILLVILKYKSKIKILLIIPTLILIFERFYLSIIIFITYLLYYLNSKENVLKKILIFTFCIFMSILTFSYYFKNQDIFDVFNIIGNFADTHNNSIDVTPTTNIFLDLFRIFFTPFFNLYKLDMYNKFDSLLTWGSFVHQSVMLFYLKGLWCYRKNTFTILNLSFLFLMLVLALIAPYNGRARDSLYPLIVIYSAIGISSIFNRRK